MIHQVKASSFADPRDIAAFKRCKSRGGTDQECFKIGDNGIGAWGDDCSEGSGLSCALPPEDMVETWGSVDDAHLKEVEVVIAGTQSAICKIKDRMPHRRHITNGAGIDLNPDAVRALGFEPPLMENATWEDL